MLVIKAITAMALSNNDQTDGEAKANIIVAILQWHWVMF